MVVGGGLLFSSALSDLLKRGRKRGEGKKCEMKSNEKDGPSCIFSSNISLIFLSWHKNKNKKLQKEQQMRPKVGRRKDIVKIRLEINETKT